VLNVKRLTQGQWTEFIRDEEGDHENQKGDSDAWPEGSRAASVGSRYSEIRRCVTVLISIDAWQERSAFLFKRRLSKKNNQTQETQVVFRPRL
jgi:hypothetical protein